MQSKTNQGWGVFFRWLSGWKSDKSDVVKPLECAGCRASLMQCRFKSELDFDLWPARSIKFKQVWNSFYEVWMKNIQITQKNLKFCVFSELIRSLVLSLHLVRNGAGYTLFVKYGAITSWVWSAGKVLWNIKWMLVGWSQLPKGVSVPIKIIHKKNIAGE